MDDKRLFEKMEAMEEEEIFVFFLSGNNRFRCRVEFAGVL